MHRDVCWQFAGPGTVVLTVSVTDRDVADNARISLSCYALNDEEVRHAQLCDI